MGHSLNLKIKLEQKGQREKRSHFFLVLTVGERERRERAPSFSLRSTELRWSIFVGPRTKVHRIDQGYAWVPRTRDFAEDPRKESREIEVVRLRRLPNRSSTLQEVWILPTLVLVPIFLLIFGLKKWKKLRGCLGRKYEISVLARWFSPR